ncbi:hypothetical protein [Pelagibius sp.]|uniref:hypothetical protein n=1 Tax=Pelagibius sp. TaxID=1931238 RepID=UPI002626E816|nr:hypothetical protein [Pelagibius sp.]
MKYRNRVLSLSAAVAGVGLILSAAPAVAEDAFAEWGAVSTEALSEERGKAFEIDEDSLATAIGAQYQHVTFDGMAAVGSGGEIHLGSHTFADQVMSLNVMNTGNNVALQNQNVVAVTVIDSSVSLP